MIREKDFVFIDLKKEKVGYEGDNPPIGIVLTKQKDDLLVKYAMHNISSQLFVSKYQLYMPDREELRAVIEEQLNNRVTKCTCRY